MAELFPDINEVLEEDKKNEGNQDVIENLEEILSNIDRETPFEFEFFTGGKNKKFDELMQDAALSPDNLEFLEFLQSDQCKQIFIENKLKINVESSNIYYDNTDTNEGILDFIFNQQNPVTGDIDLKIKDFFNSYLLILTVFNIGNLKTINSSPLTFTSKSFLSLGESGVKVIFASVGLK